MSLWPGRGFGGGGLVVPGAARAASGLLAPLLPRLLGDDGL